MSEIVFVYGTLTDAEQADQLLDSFRFVGEAICEGLHRVDGSYPTLLPGGTVSGRLLVVENLSRLDAYEGVDRGLYVRVAVPVESPDGTTALPSETISNNTSSADTTTFVYIGVPARLGIDVPPEQSWPNSGLFADRVVDYIERHSVRIVRKEHADDSRQTNV